MFFGQCSSLKKRFILWRDRRVHMSRGSQTESTEAFKREALRGGLSASLRVCSRSFFSVVTFHCQLSILLAWERVVGIVSDVEFSHETSELLVSLNITYGFSPPLSSASLHEIKYSARVFLFALQLFTVFLLEFKFYAAKNGKIPASSLAFPNVLIVTRQALKSSSGFHSTSRFNERESFTKLCTRRWDGAWRNFLCALSTCKSSVGNFSHHWQIECRNSRS